MPKNRMVSSRNTSAMAMVMAWRRTIPESLNRAAAPASEPKGRKCCSHVVQRAFGNRPSPRHGLMQARQVKVHAVVHHRVDDRKADRTAQIAREVEQARGPAHLYR